MTVPVVGQTITGIFSDAASGSGTGTLSTTSENYAFIVITNENNSSQTVASVGGGTLAWTKYAGFQNTANDLNQEIWSAPITAPLAGEIVTVTLTAVTDDCSFGVFCCTGVYAPSPFDTPVGMPAQQQSTSASPAFVEGVSTSGTDTLLVCVFSYATSGSSAVPAGFTNIVFVENAGGANYSVTNVSGQGQPTPVSDITLTNPNSYNGIPWLASAFAISSGPLSVTVPNIVGLSTSDAITALESVGLTVGTETPVVDPSAPGTVVSQTTPAGAVVSPPYTVGFSYSTGVQVPDVTNTSADTVAPEILAAAGFVVGAITYKASGVVIKGNVISQSPTAGSFAAGGSGVNLIVSSGLPPLTVPDLFEMTQADATALLLSLGFVVGAVGSQPSSLIPAGTVMLQNPTAGTPLPPGSIVSFVLSTGEPATSNLFDFETTVISQYANSPTIMQLVANLNQYIDQSANFANFYNYIWNIDSAVGFGLDIWGVIVGVSRLLNIPTGVAYVGFDISTESQPDQDWTPAGSNQPPYNNPPVGGAMYTGYSATTAYLLPDDAYRQLILTKAFANICTTTAPAINRILQNLYGAGTAYVLNTGRMAISYNLTFTPTPIQLAILEQSGVIPTPPGVAVTINTNV